MLAVSIIWPNAIRLVAVLMFMCASVSALAQTSEEMAEWRRTHVPASEFRYAYEFYIGDGRPMDREKARLELLLFALRRPPNVLADNRAFAKDQRWQRAFIDALDKAAEFAAEVRVRHPDEVLDLSRSVRKERTSANETLADTLLVIASELGSMSADLEIGQRQVDSPRRAHDSVFGRGTIKHLAEIGFAPALLDLVQRYQSGRGFDRSLQKAYYWALRASAYGLPMADPLAELREDLTPAQIFEVDDWIIRNVNVNP